MKFVFQASCLLLALASIPAALLYCLFFPIYAFMAIKFALRESEIIAAILFAAQLFLGLYGVGSLYQFYFMRNISISEIPSDVKKGIVSGLASIILLMYILGGPNTYLVISIPPIALSLLLIAHAYYITA
jgi:hypothetical protein